MKLTIIVISLLSLLAFCYLVSASDTYTGFILYPQNEVRLMSSDATGTTIYNMSTYYTPTKMYNTSVAHINGGDPEYYIYCLEFNASSLPCNITLNNISFWFSSNYHKTVVDGVYSFFNMSNGTALIPFSQSLSTGMFYDFWYSSAKKLIANVYGDRFSIFAGAETTFKNMSSNTTTQDDLNDEYAQTNYDGYWMKNYISELGTYGHSVKIAFQNASRNYPQYLFQMGFYTGDAAHNQTFATNINTTCAQRPCFYMNFSYNISSIISTNFSNNSNIDNNDIFTFNLSNPYGDRIKYRIHFYDIDTSTYTNETTYLLTPWAGAIDYNYSLTYQFKNLTNMHNYFFWIELPGNITTQLYRFSCGAILPPSSVVATDYNSTCLNFTFDPLTLAGGSTYTVCYYQTGTIPPAYGVGTLGGNFSGNGTIGWINITGLSKSTTYTFTFWSYWNTSTTGYLSSFATNVTNTTSYGSITFCLRYENVTTDATPINSLIDLTYHNWKNSTHRLVIYYDNASSSIYTFNATNPGNQTLTLSSEPLFFEFTWNYSTNQTSNFTSTYKRILTPHATTTEGSNEICTFYLTTDKNIYWQYYTHTDAAGNSNNTLEQNLNNLVEFSFLYDDQSGFFNPTNTYSTYATIYTYTGTNRIVIDERYLDAALKTNPVLNYKAYYFTKIASTINTNINDYYDKLGFAPTGNSYTYAPTTETIIISPLSANDEDQLSNVTYKFGWLTDGFWIHFYDTSYSTTNLMFTVWNASNSTTTPEFLDIFWVNGTNSASDYNYTYTTTNPWHDNITYKIITNISYTFDSGKSSAFSMNYITIFKPSLYQQITGSVINGVFTLIFGPSPFYNPDTGYTVTYVDILIAFIGFMFLLTFGAMGQPVAGLGAQGITYIGATFLVSGLSTGFIIAGSLLMILAVLYAIRLGGKE